MDKFPQPLKFQVAGPNATDDLGNAVVFPLILARSETANKRIVTEVTRVTYDVGGAVSSFATTLDGLSISVSFRALTAAENDHIFPTATIGHEAVLDRYQVNLNDDADLVEIPPLPPVPGTPATSHIRESVFSHDLVNSVGRGQIFPGDTLFINLSTDVDLSLHTIGVSIEYRQHLVGLTEFLGILAARQQQ